MPKPTYEDFTARGLKVLICAPFVIVIAIASVPFWVLGRIAHLWTPVEPGEAGRR